MNFLAILVASLIPLLVGMIWYNPHVFGTAWMHSIGKSDPEEMKKGANMALIFGLSFVFALLLSLAMAPLTIHQFGITSLLESLPEETKHGKVEMLVGGVPFDYENLFRTFGHGAFHGVFYGILIVIPILGTNALFEMRGFKYIAINSGYWIICMALMGGLICAWQ